jgi:hypothetical protein
MLTGSAIAVFACLAAVGTASADTVLSPGATGQTPDNETTEIAGLTYVQSISGVFDSISFNGTYIAAVYSGTNDVCTGAGCLTFLYQITDTSGANSDPGLITTVSASSFGGFTTEVGYATAAPSSNTAGFVAGTIIPTTIQRNATPGAVVQWNYTSTTDIEPGTTSDILVVETNANASLPGLFSGLGDATATVTAYGATSLQTTPEPTTLVLFGSALIGLGCIRKRIRKS